MSSETAKEQKQNNEVNDILSREDSLLETHLKDTPLVSGISNN